MLINNVHIPGKGAVLNQIEIKDSIISGIDNNAEFITNPDDITLNFSNALAFPGLINSHDHLEFNLFPKLSSRTYTDYVEWGNDIHNLYKGEIEKVKKIPYNLRYKWGLYKNLICGVTTVVHHGNGDVFHFKGLPDVHTHYNYLHSIRLEKRWKWKLNNPFNSYPFVIHIGEGTNNESSREINELINRNIIRKQLIGVHGISMHEIQIKKFKALVWCPESNFFLYDKTADISKLKRYTDILFGTDSTLTSDWNIWNHLRAARRLGFLNDDELYNSLTETASEIWGISSIGSISRGKNADIVIVKGDSRHNFDNLFNANPEAILLIIKNGKIVLIDESFQREQAVVSKNDYDLIKINSVKKYVTKGIIRLMREIRSYIPDYNFPVKPVS